MLEHRDVVLDEIPDGDDTDGVGERAEGQFGEYRPGKFRRNVMVADQ